MRNRSESRGRRGPDYDPPGQRRPPAGQAGRRRAPGGRARAVGSRPRPRRWRHPRLAKTGYAAVTFLTVVVVLASLGAYAVYRHLAGNIKVVSVSGLTHRSVYGVQNILLLGSQTRKGQGKGFGSNICGPSCAVKTVKDFTGVKIHHFVMFNFNSFRAMVDAIGGVEVCVPRGGYHDPWSRLNLSGGKHLLTYNQALAYVRTRHGVQAEGDVGGDLPRIELQQAFISSVVQKVNSQGILGNSLQLLKIADTATKALTVDTGLNSVSKLLGLARTLIHLRASHVTLITVPTVPDTNPGFSGRLLPEQPQDDVIFQMITSGQPWHHGLPTLRPGKVKVQVLNGSGITGLAGRTAHGLRQYGFDVTGVGNATTPVSTTTVTYSGTAQADSAYTLMTALKATPAAQHLLAESTPQTGHAGVVTLILGPDFAGVNPPAAPRTGKASHRKRRKTRSSGYGSAGFVQTRNAGASICSGLPQANPNPGRPP